MDVVIGRQGEMYVAIGGRQTRGGVLSIAWAGLSQGLDVPVMMTGPAVTVFESEIELP